MDAHAGCTRRGKKKGMVCERESTLACPERRTELSAQRTHSEALPPYTECTDGTYALSQALAYISATCPKHTCPKHTMSSIIATRQVQRWHILAWPTSQQQPQAHTLEATITNNSPTFGSH
eukprot:1159863-Pelagomonas_calceolata.AAC.3